jgi:hypothetical protein
LTWLLSGLMILESCSDMTTPPSYLIYV